MDVIRAREPWQSTGEVVGAQRRSVVVLFVAQILGGLGLGAGVAMGALLAEEVTRDDALAGISRTLSTLGTAIFAVPLVMVAARLGRRVALTAGWALAVVGAAALVGSLAWVSIPLLMVGMLIFGAGQAANLQSRFAATDLALPRNRARSLSLIVWATTVGTVLGPNLAGPGETVAGWFALPAIAGPYLIGAVGLVLGALVTWIGLRPDPLLLAREHTVRAAEGTPEEPALDRREVLRTVRGLPLLRTALVAVVLNQTVMVTVMTMAPVHMSHHDMTLPMVGFALSLHTLGMFAFSPLVGMVADRLGEVVTILVGALITLVSLGFCFAAGESMGLITIGLFLLGLGWSFAMVAGSALLTRAAPDRIRAQVQGLSDTTMNLVAALGAAAAGPVLAVWGYPWLSVIAAVLVVVIIVLVVPQRRHR